MTKFRRIVIGCSKEDRHTKLASEEAWRRYNTLELWCGSPHMGLSLIISYGIAFHERS